MPAYNTGYLHLRGQKSCTLLAFRAGFSVFPTEKLPQLRKMQLAPSVRRQCRSDKLTIIWLKNL